MASFLCIEHLYYYLFIFFGFCIFKGGLLGNKPLGFGTTTSASTGFGTGGGLFNKPATTSTFSFGTGSTGFGGKL